MQPQIEFWYEFSSTYSYLAAMRIDQVANRAGVDVRWRPFLLGPIFKAQGYSDSPYNLFPVKGRYMWRDLERLCAKQRLPLLRPETFPQNGVQAARCALVCFSLGYGRRFSRAVFSLEFGAGRDIADEATLREAVKKAGGDPDMVLERAGSQEIKDRLREQTAEAEERGLFGAPSFIASGELFWGNDRLDEALAWAKGERAYLPNEEDPYAPNTGY